MSGATRDENGSMVESKEDVGGGEAGADREEERGEADDIETEAEGRSARGEDPGDGGLRERTRAGRGGQSRRCVKDDDRQLVPRMA